MTTETQANDLVPVLARAIDLHEKAAMPWPEAERLALSEAGIDDAEIDEVVGEAGGLEMLLTTPDDLRDFARSVLVHGSARIAAIPAPDPAPCRGGNPTCPCQDGDLCHYVDAPDGSTKAMPIPAPEGALHAFKNFHQRLCERFGYFHDEQDWQRDLCSLEEHIAALAGPAPQAPDMVSVPLTVLEDASSSLGHYLSDRGWSDEDMQAMDNLDAYIARHKANAAAKQTKEPTNDR